MTSENKWRIIWGGWLAAGVIAEVVALNSEDKSAALSHHLRQNTHILGKTHVGRVALLAGATWLHRHLYRPMLEEARAISKIKGQAK
jgi:hypothetical protein